MKDLLISITKGLVDNPDAVSVDVDEPNEEGVVFYHSKGYSRCYARGGNKKR